MTTIRKTTYQLIKGDVIVQHGGRFELVEELQVGFPDDSGYWPQSGVGPSDCVFAQSVCIEGQVSGYFKPGSDWTIQGNRFAVWAVEVPQPVKTYPEYC